MSSYTPAHYGTDAQAKAVLRAARDAAQARKLRDKATADKAAADKVNKAADKATADKAPPKTSERKVAPGNKPDPTSPPKSHQPLRALSVSVPGKKPIRAFSRVTTPRETCVLFITPKPTVDPEVVELFVVFKMSLKRHARTLAAP